MSLLRHVNEIHSADILEDWTKRCRRNWLCYHCDTYNTDQLANQSTVTKYYNSYDKTIVEICVIYNCFNCDTAKVFMHVLSNYPYFPAAYV